MTQLEIENDAGTPVTVIDLGAIYPEDFSQKKFIVKNVGDTIATSVTIQTVRIAQTDGLEHAYLANDNGGNPDTYSTNPISVGTLAAGASYLFWLKISVPLGASPVGNPRIFNLTAKYQGS
jgi:hypothetical protein